MIRMSIQSLNVYEILLIPLTNINFILLRTTHLYILCWKAIKGFMVKFYYVEIEDACDFFNIVLRQKILGKDFQNTTDEDNHAKHDPKNQEAVMSVKLSLTNDMFT